MTPTLSYMTAIPPSKKAVAPSRKPTITRGYVFVGLEEFSFPAIVAPKENPQEMHSEQYEGYTKEQFLTALKAVSRPMAEKAQAAKAAGMVGKEEARRILNEALNADA